MSAVGASERLQTVIAGESLVNDGVAFVMFEVRGQSSTGAAWLGDPAFQHSSFQHAAVLRRFFICLACLQGAAGLP